MGPRIREPRALGSRRSRIRALSSRRRSRTEPRNLGSRRSRIRAISSRRSWTGSLEFESLGPGGLGGLEFESSVFHPRRCWAWRVFGLLTWPASVGFEWGWPVTQQMTKSVCRTLLKCQPWKLVSKANLAQLITLFSQRTSRCGWVLYVPFPTRWQNSNQSSTNKITRPTCAVIWIYIYEKENNSMQGKDPYFFFFF
jgi:hypothetical protein